jgi:TfuA protein
LRAILFVGPSLEKSDLPRLPIELLDIRPPVKRGDVPQAIHDGYSIIGIIDGVFSQDVAVSPKEVWQALKVGATVIGGASMGALRAVELNVYGAIGVGHVYEWFRSNRLSRDDDVAVVYTESDSAYIVQTTPMVNVIWVVERARDRELVSPSLANLILASARRLDWRHRTWPGVLADPEISHSLPADFLAFATDPQNNLKRLDALAVAQRVIQYIYES